MFTAIIMTAVLLALVLGVERVFCVLRRLFIPASLIAGLVGLILVQLLAWTPLAEEANKLSTEWKSWPGPLIAVVFAGMLLGRSSTSAGNSLRRAGRQALMVWVIVLGQTAVGLLATWLIIQPVFGVPASFGMLIETGFAGGHGTAAAMGQVFAQPSPMNDGALILESGQDLGTMMATIGLVYGLLSGVFWVNIGVRRRWAGGRGQACGTENVARCEPSGVEGSPPPTSSASDSVDTLLVQAVWLVLAIALGLCYRWMVDRTAETVLPTQSITKNFPLFIYTLFGGWTIRQMLTATGAADLIDAKMIGRISASAMDVLVLSAMASLSLSALSGNLGGIVILFVVAAAWTSFCLVGLSRRILPSSHWFELGLINYGMSTGTTATGLVLLRMLDPELQGQAAEDYALAAPISSPFIGGGMITIAMPALVLQTVLLPVAATAVAIVTLVLIFVGIRNRDSQPAVDA